MLGMCLLVLAMVGSSRLRARLARPVVADGKTPPTAHDPQAVTDEEWATHVWPWMLSVRPNQAAVLDKMPQGLQRDQAKQLVARQYREIKSIPLPALQKARTDQIKAQDELFGAQVKFREARRAGLRGPKLDEARGAVQTAVEHLFDAQIAERQVRIDRLQAEITQLEKNKGTMIARWTKEAINQGGRATVNASPSPTRAPGDSAQPPQDQQQNNAEPAGKR
ncbi:MAG TPA: hypothetical protein VGI81_17710 [Tepidisphaeraceae bacterium]|jgi:hypothetical protein